MFCPSCGTQVPDDVSFCFKCGRPMSIAPNAAAPRSGEVTSTKHRTWSRQHVLSGLAVVAALGCIVLYLNRELPLGAAAPRGGSAFRSDSPKESSSVRPEGGSVDSTSTETQSESRRDAVAAVSPTSKQATGNIAPKPAPDPPAPVKLSPGEIAAKYSDAVVVLESYNDQGQKLGQGSGFIFLPDGRVFTNYHVIRGAARMQVQMHDQSTHDVEYIAGFDMQHDLAALKIDGGGFPFVRLGNSSAVKVGDHVTALGAPLGLDSTLSDGIISALRDAGPIHLFQTSAPISHGSSGGPLFNDDGDVIALAVSIVEAGENLNFAVPIDLAKGLLKSGHQTSFAELLSLSAVHQSLLATSLSVPPQAIGWDLVVPQQGGLLSGSFSISGGAGNDLGVSVMSGITVVWNGGVVKGYGTLSVPLRGGRYKLVFNNKMAPWWVSSKTVSGKIELSYYQ
jgi:S1-C subfamily serine protease